MSATGAQHLSDGIQSIPKRACWLTEAFAEQEPIQQSADSPNRFRMVANSGKPFENWWWGKVAVDLEGAEIATKTPALFEHDTNRPVGFSDLAERRDEGLYYEGPMLSEEPDGARMLRLSAAGFPFQASVYIPPKEVQILEDNETAEVNGYKFEGPGAIIRRSRVREISFAVLGADPNTNSEAYAEGDDLPVTITRGKGATMSQSSNSKQKATSKPAASAAAEGSTGEPKPVEFTADLLRENAPDLVDQFRAEGVAEALKAERERVGEIFANSFAFAKQCGSPESMAQFEACALGSIQEGKLAADARKDLMETMTRVSFAQRPENPGSEEAAPARTDQFAGLEGEELWKAQFAASEDLQANYVSVEDYVAYMKATEKGLTERGRK